MLGTLLIFIVAGLLGIDLVPFITFAALIFLVINVAGAIFCKSFFCIIIAVADIILLIFLYDKSFSLYDILVWMF